MKHFLDLYVKLFVEFSAAAFWILVAMVIFDGIKDRRANKRAWAKRQAWWVERESQPTNVPWSEVGR